jgi:hypothetical protein
MVRVAVTHFTALCGTPSTVITDRHFTAIITHPVRVRVRVRVKVRVIVRVRVRVSAIVRVRDRADATIGSIKGIGLSHSIVNIITHSVRVRVRVGVRVRVRVRVS